MSKQTLKFNDIVVSKKDFYALKRAIPLNSVNTSNIVMSYRFKHNDDSCKYFIGYLHDDLIRPLCVILPQRVVISNILTMEEKRCHLKLKKRVFI